MQLYNNIRGHKEKLVPLSEFRNDLCVSRRTLRLCFSIESLDDVGAALVVLKGHFDGKRRRETIVHNV